MRQLYSSVPIKIWGNPIKKIGQHWREALLSLVTIALAGASMANTALSVMAPPASIDFDERSSVNDAIDDNTFPGQFVGTIIPAGGDAPFTYSLVAGDGDTDNARFTISNDSLFAAQFIDFETHPDPTNLSIRVRAADAADAGLEQTIALTIRDIDEATTANFGSQGDEFLVNNFSPSIQQRPAITQSSNGNFVIVWQNQEDGIFAERYDATANRIGGEIRVDDLNNDNQKLADVAIADNGDFVVVWQGSGNTNGDGTDIIARLYAADGTAGSEFIVNTVTAGEQDSARVAMNATGNFIVAWQGSGAGDDSGIFFRRFQANGTATDVNQQLANTTVAGNQYQPAVGLADDGKFAISWTSAGDIIYRFYDNSLVGSTEATVNSATAGDHSLSDLSMRGNGAFIVSWQEEQTADIFGIYARRFNNTGLPTAAQFTVSEPSADQFASHVSMADNGTFVITFTGPGSGNEVLARRFDADRNPLGAAFEVNKLRLNTQRRSDIALSEDGSFVVAWEGFTDAGNYDIYAQRYYANAAPTTIALDNLVLTNGSPESTPVGTLSTTDPNAEDEFFYALVSGDGSDDNAMFRIQGNQLLVTERVDVTTKPSYNVRIRSTDALGLFSATSEATFAITIDETNSIPVVAVNTGLAVEQRDTVTVTQTALEVTDTESTAADAITYTLVTAPVNGSLQKSGTALAADEKFTQADINNGLITYVQSGTRVTADSLTFLATDEAGAATLKTQVNITISLLTAPVANAGSDQVITDEDNDGQADVVLDGSASSDADGTITSYVWRQNESDVVSGVNPTLTLNVGTNIITLVVTDDDLQTATDTVVVTINAPENAPPTLTANNGLSLAQQGTVATITSAELEATDDESAPEAITFTLTQVPVNGVLQLSGADLAVAGTFTQKDINDGLLSYTNNGTSEASDSVKFTVADAGGGTVPETTFTIAINIVTGLGDEINGEIVVVYPNPSQELLYIKMKNNFDKVQIDVSNNMGKLLKSVHLNTSDLRKTPVDISDLTKGTYFVRIQADQQTVVRKLIKE